MYTKMQKIGIYVNCFLAICVVGIFNLFVAHKALMKVYDTGRTLPWILPHYSLFPVRAVLYALLSVAGAMVYTKRASNIRSFALSAWLFQLILNILWPIPYYFIPTQMATPILISVLFMVLIVFMFYGFLLNRKVVLFTLPFILMVVYQMVFHWIFYILNY